jgi:uncharacterized protein (DUF427 family)
MTESVWDYPRPPRLEPSARLIEVRLAGVTIASTSRGHRVLETSHPPVYYIPREDVLDGVLEVVRGGGSFCEWKGSATYLDVRAPNGRRVPRGAWTYKRPTPEYVAIADAVAFYPALMDRCTVDGERVRPQPGGFYGGWVTDDLVGPFKGAPGTLRW